LTVRADWMTTVSLKMNSATATPRLATIIGANI
jgi:hypothetical protein